jgi:hypothetical protein
MTDITNSSLNNREDYLDTDNDKTQDSGNSDAAKFNTDEQEQFVNERMEAEDVTAQNTDADTTSVINQPPLTTQGDITEVEENMGGTTNLTLDQLKKEGDPEGMDGE